MALVRNENRETPDCFSGAPCKVPFVLARNFVPLASETRPEITMHDELKISPLNLDVLLINECTRFYRVQIFKPVNFSSAFDALFWRITMELFEWTFFFKESCKDS